MKRLVSDTGPLLHLHEAGCLDLLSQVGQVVVPLEVIHELRRFLPPAWFADLPGWIHCQSLTPRARERAGAWQQAGLLQAGESEALSLALELRPDWLLTDDAAARLMAESLGLEAHGSLGVLLWVAARGLLKSEDAETRLTALERSSLWLSPKVRKEARAALKQIFAPPQA